MALYMIGIGLHDEKDITVKGLEAVRRCSMVFLENYTSRLAVDIPALEEFYGKKITPADRELIETRIEEGILEPAKDEDVALLVIGDPFSATTHTDIRLRAKEMGVVVNSIHNASVLTAIGITGLELYKFGKVTSIPFGNENVKTPVDVFRMNSRSGLHTLFLLDLNPKDDKYMKTTDACTYLLAHDASKDLTAIACAGLGSDRPEIVCSTLEELEKQELKQIPQCLIIPGKLHFVEEEAIDEWRV